MLIHGGDGWKSYEVYLEYLKNYEMTAEKFKRLGLQLGNYQVNLTKNLGDGFEVIRPEMPNKRNAKYIEWKIWFEKFFPFIRDDVILIGGSLGGTFLAKYLAENDFPKKIKAIILISACFEDLAGEPLLDFSLPASLKKIESQTGKIILYHSKDDDVVPFSHLAKFQQALPTATVRIFEDRQHFNQIDLPELVEDIKKL